MTETQDMVMPVAPMGAAYGGGLGGGFGYNSEWWLILILLFAFGGWGGFGGFGGFGGAGNVAADTAVMYPWMNQSNQIHDGFRDQMLNTTVNGIQNAITSGFGDVQLGIAGINQGICQTGNAITSAVANGFSQAEMANNSRQVANMQQAFANQTAMNQGFNGLTSQLAQCCCDNRLATAQTQALVQSENCADRAALSDGIRDIIESNTRNTQAILDKLCNQEIDALKTANANLQSQVLMRDLAASQAAQTTQLIADNTAQTQYIVNRVAPYPIPSYSVPSPYGTVGCACGAY